MIQLNCTNCKALLTIDEAFAGGACRCRHCGTIQTVPKHLKDNGDGVGSSGVLAQAASGSKSKSPKSLYKKRTAVAGETPGTGLDELAEIVASSGLSSNRLTKSNVPAAQPKAGPKDKKMLMLVSSAGGVIALLLGIIIFMAVRDKTNNEKVAEAQSGGGVASQPANPAITEPVTPKVEKLVMKKPPHFLNQSLKEQSIVYVLDHGYSSSADGRLTLIKTGLINSLHSLGPQRRFQVIFWDVPGQPVAAFPPEGLAQATEENIVACDKFLAEIFPVGQTQAPIGKAFASGAEAVVLVPVKTELLDDSLQKDLAKVRKEGKSAKLYCLTIGHPNIVTALRKIIVDAKGTYKDISLQDARNSLTE
jgi:hypothetical protein